MSSLLRFFALMDRALPQSLSRDPELKRKSHLVLGFGILGLIFGISYVSFYIAIQHYWGALIVGICAAGVSLTPGFLWLYKSVDLPGHTFAFIFNIGFLGMCFVEGGIRSHAIAWLATVPLIALLLVGRFGGMIWGPVALFEMSTIVALHFEGFGLKPLYDPKWEFLVSTVGYLGLAMFMFMLGLMFESGRVKANLQVQQTSEKLIALNERLVHLNKEKSEFLGIAAHDLRNPLAIIMANAELIRVLDGSGDVQSRAGVIAASAQRMQQLISNLLDVHAIEEGEYVTKVSICDVNDVAQELVGHYRDLASRKQISVEVILQNLPCVETDSDALRQILDNLVSNAVKYSPKGGAIRLETCAVGEGIVVNVCDTGPGFSVEDKKKLFHKFSRLSAKPTGEESSHGLGLAVVQRLAEALHGRVECHSVHGEGATFSLILPLKSG